MNLLTNNILEDTIMAKYKMHMLVCGEPVAGLRRATSLQAALQEVKLRKTGWKMKYRWLAPAASGFAKKALS
jgi:hypothetical protein